MGAAGSSCARRRRDGERASAVLIIINLILSFTFANISGGAHIGGLIGGALAALAIRSATATVRWRSRWLPAWRRRRRVRGVVAVSSRPQSTGAGAGPRADRAELPHSMASSERGPLVADAGRPGDRHASPAASGYATAERSCASGSSRTSRRRSPSSTAWPTSPRWPPPSRHLLHGWNKVRLELSTHSEGGLTEADFGLAPHRPLGVNGLKLILAVVLIAINAFFVVAEYALVRSRSARLELMREEGSRGAALALSQLDRINEYISAVQIGVTMTSLASARSPRPRSPAFSRTRSAARPATTRRSPSRWSSPS